MKALLLSIALVFASAIAHAAHLRISPCELMDKSIENGCIQVQFGIAWDGSWRSNSASKNWDAVWLFVKYQKTSDKRWYHATLNTKPGNSSAGTNAKEAIISIPTGGTGALILRNKDGDGLFSSGRVRLQWDYFQDSLPDNVEDEILQVKVYGIEMVYVPEAPFWVGGVGNEFNTFYKSGAEKLPYQICSEEKIKLGNKEGRLSWAEGNASGVPDGNVPEAFPKGFNGFYLMKYEVNQSQYAEFLNTLSQAQAKNRFRSKDFRVGYCIRYVDGVYGCDANKNDTLNEANDGQETACNGLSWADGAAFADWAGLSPMTELEYEKACRGPLSPIANEFAWGTANIVQASIAQNPYASNEYCSRGNCNYLDSSDADKRPLRNGIFDTLGASREASGKGYYGNCELSGNLWERVITIGNRVGRAFDGHNGNGRLDDSGDADEKSWPGPNASGTGFRGGSWNASMQLARTSDRYSAANAMANMNGAFGFRCCLRFRR